MCAEFHSGQQKVFQGNGKTRIPGRYSGRKNERLYFSDDIDTDGTRKFIINNNTKKSCGPNGEYGDYDDGLPSSYQEFYKLLEKMNRWGTTC